jgi:excinuclease UvrABC nuclease subunit
MRVSTTCTVRDGIPFRRSSIETVIPAESGIYMFWSKKFCLYVGKADNLRERLISHWGKSHNPDLRLWIKAHGADLCITFKTIDENLQNAEQELIDRLSPHLNKINARAK